MSKDRILESLYLKTERFRIFTPFYDSVLTRLSNTHFRSPRLALAGNFLPEWVSPSKIVRAFGEELTRNAVELIGNDDFGTHSLELSADNVVGWSSTIRLEDLPETVSIERFAPNRRSSALRVAIGDTMLAPFTRRATFIFELIDHDRGPMMIVRSIYPGPDIGELRDDITEREGIVFFDFDHPGIPYV